MIFEAVSRPSPKQSPRDVGDCFVALVSIRPSQQPLRATRPAAPRNDGNFLILSRKLFVDPEELVAFVQHADETAEAKVFGFEQGVEFAQGGVLGARPNAAFKVSCICYTRERA